VLSTALPLLPPTTALLSEGIGSRCLLRREEQTEKNRKRGTLMKCIRRGILIFAVLLVVMGPHGSPFASAQEKKPNILFIMGDDVGWFNVGAYHQGIMSGKTPNLDKLAAQGMRFTDYYAEASCTAGRASRTSWLSDRPSRGGLHHRYRTKVDGVRHWAIRQEPSWRSE
jgi:hypothetical protein